MKRNLLLLLLVTSLCFNSCSLVQDKEPGEEIMGTWTLIDINHPEIYDPEACSEDTVVLFLEDDEVKTFYNDGECNPLTSIGTWDFLEEDQYLIELFPEIGQTEGRIYFESVHIFKFSTKIGGQLVIFTFERK